MHLQIAERILSDGSMGARIHQLISIELPAFYLGNVAPDYQTITDIPREETHFYSLPPVPGSDACQTMMKRYRQLANAEVLPQAQAVFIAAYCAHLMLDLAWYHRVLVPYFLGPGEWKNHRHRFIVHNTLLTYLDKQAFNSLPGGVEMILSAARPNGWLPFASDEELARWRDMLVSQMEPGATLNTIEIYAGRLSMSPVEFAHNLDEPSWMEEQVFQKIPLKVVLDLLDNAVGDSIKLINQYLSVH